MAKFHPRVYYYEIIYLFPFSYEFDIYGNLHVNLVNMRIFPSQRQHSIFLNSQSEVAVLINTDNGYNCHCRTCTHRLLPSRHFNSASIHALDETTTKNNLKAIKTLKSEMWLKEELEYSPKKVSERKECKNWRKKIEGVDIGTVAWTLCALVFMIWTTPLNSVLRNPWSLYLVYITTALRKHGYDVFLIPTISES